MGSLLTLNTHIPWVRILEILDCPVRSHALPARTTCPLCQGSRLNIYEDTTTDGAWHYCFDCRSAGDMIELVARAWGVKVEATFDRLVAEGALPQEFLTPESTQKYLVNYKEHKEKIAKFWEHCRLYLANTQSKYLASLRQTLRLVSHVDEDRWLKGPSNLMGAAHRLTVEHTLNPRKLRAVENVLRGYGWSEVLAFPYESTPGYTIGMLFVGRDAQPGDCIYKRFGWRSAVTDDTGLWGLWSVREAGIGSGDPVVAVSDPMLGMRIQLRHFNMSSRPLPIVAYYDGKRGLTQGSWGCLSDYTVIVWGWRLTASLLIQAVTTNGYMSLAPVAELDTKSIDHYVRHDEPRELYRKIIKRARPWQEVIKTWCDRATPSEISNLVTDLVPYTKKDIVVDVEPRLAKSQHQGPRRYKSRRTVYTEAGGAWWISSFGKRQRQLTNFIVRIDRSSMKEGKAHYCGRLLFKGQELPFELPVAVFNTIHGNPLQEVVAQVGGILMHQPPSKTVELALAFHVPAAS